MAYGIHQADSLGIYISIPFCRSKCTFCNFASGVYPAHELPRYLEQVVAEISATRRSAAAHGLVLPDQVDTVYFGGGTPSILSPAQLRSLLAAMREQFTVQRGAEITLEAAPGFLADDLLATAAEIGVSRISFGVQTFVDAEARAVGRLHQATQSLDDVARARRAGMAVSLDLIAGLPSQTAASWRHSLETLIASKPEHASVYMLEVDEDSRLGSEMLLGGTRYGAALTPPDDAVADFYIEACETLTGAGLAQYEISNFARLGHASRHNLRYWQRRPYLGFGLDAHSMLRASVGTAVRFGTTDDLPEYLAAQPDCERAWARSDLRRLSAAEELEEAWFLGLRCNAGVRLDEVRQEFAGRVRAAIVEVPGESSRAVVPDTASDDPLEPFLPILADLAQDDLLILKGSGTQLTAALTARGRLLSNEVFARFLGVAESEPATLKLPQSGKVI